MTPQRATDRLIVAAATLAVLAMIAGVAWVRPNRDAAAPPEPPERTGVAGESTAYPAPSLPMEVPGSAPAATPDDAPPPLGPGAGIAFDPSTAPVVPDGMSTDAYVTAYFDAVVAQDWDTAARMVPTAEPARATERFLELLQEYQPTDSAIVESAETSESGRTLVFVFTTDNGAWNVEWEWVSTPRGLAVKDIRYSRPGFEACH